MVVKDNFIELEVVVEEPMIELEVSSEVVGGIGTTDYDLLINKPSANGILLKGKVEVTSYITNEEMERILKF